MPGGGLSLIDKNKPIPNEYWGDRDTTLKQGESEHDQNRYKVGRQVKQGEQRRSHIKTGDKEIPHLYRDKLLRQVQDVKTEDSYSGLLRRPQSQPLPTVSRTRFIDPLPSPSQYRLFRSYY